MTGSPRACPPDRRSELDAALTKLHGRQEHAAELSALHEEAAKDFVKTLEEQRFHLTHAWIYALVDGDDTRTSQLEDALRRLGGIV